MQSRFISFRAVLPTIVLCVVVALSIRAGHAQVADLDMDDLDIEDAGGAAADSLFRVGDDYLNAGRYVEARSVLRDVLEKTPHHDGALEYAQSFVLAGAYGDGLNRITELIAGTSDAPRLFQARGRLLVAVGRYEEAEEDFREALTLKNDLWTAGIDIAELFARTGRDRQAQSIYRTVYQQYKQGTFRTAHTLTAGARAAAEVGEFRDANEAFRMAFRMDERDVDNLYYWAELFRTKYNDADASRTFEDALRLNERHVPSLIGQARLSPSFERKEELAETARSINPNSVEALAILAGLRVLDGQYAEAEERARRALRVNPVSIEALAQLASVHHLRGDTTAFQDAERRVLEVDPQASDFYLGLAENATLRFRYLDAASFAGRAVDVNRTDLQARAELGTAMLRLGRRDEARRHLEAAFDGDPFNLYASNMLTLLDGYRNFSTLESEHFRLLIHEDERDVLGEDMLAVAEESFDSLSTRYPYEPSDKILIEAYGDADDFAVRIAGVPHRGLLGVSFGDVLAVNTPRAQTGRPYNWARTLWHEIAHTMAMGVSENNVPRWFTEGLSVYEEQRARPEWAREMDLAFFSALERDLLLSIEEIDRGFTRPSFPGQVQLSYYHAGKLVKYVADTYGFEAIVEMMHGLRDGAPDEAALAQATGAAVAEIDRGFLEAMRQEANAARQALEGLPDVLGDEEAEITSESIGAARGPFFETLRDGGAHVAGEQYEAAETAYRRALSMYAGYVGPGNAYEGLAAVYRAVDDEDALAEILTEYLSRAEHETDAAIELAALYEARGDSSRSALLLARTLYVIPYDRGVRERLAELYESMGRYDDAVLNRRALVALNPPDRASAFYALARSLEHAGRPAEAKRTVLRALEAAPDFREAQRLLLDLVQ